MHPVITLALRGSLCALAAVVLVSCCSWMMVRYFDLPVAEYSYTTKECVRVVLPNGSEGSCQVLPSKYRSAWVQ